MRVFTFTNVYNIDKLAIYIFSSNIGIVFNCISRRFRPFLVTSNLCMAD